MPLARLHGDPDVVIDPWTREVFIAKPASRRYTRVNDISREDDP
jgi:hypothetical protein